MMTQLDVLKSAKALVEKGWCQNTYAKTAKGKPTDSYNPNAVAWCMRGAMASAAANDFNADFVEASITLEKALGAMWIADWNDASWRTKAEVIAAFEEAINLAKVEAVSA